MGASTGGDSIRELGTRLIDDTKAYARAELDVFRAKSLVYVSAGRNAAIFGGIALILVLSALPVLIAGLGLVLAIWIGAAGGLIAAALLVILIAGILGWMAVRAIGGIGDGLA